MDSLKKSNKGGNVVFVFWYLVYFTEQRNCRFHSFFCKQCDFVLLYDQMTPRPVHTHHISLSIYLLMGTYAHSVLWLE